MIVRLEEAFKKQRQFVADASHELRTPLAIIQAESSLVLDKKRTQAEYRKSLELVSQEVAYMSEIVGKLLLLARSDAGVEPVDFRTSISRTSSSSSPRMSKRWPRKKACVHARFDGQASRSRATGSS